MTRTSPEVSAAEPDVDIPAKTSAIRPFTTFYLNNMTLRHTTAQRLILWLTAEMGSIFQDWPRSTAVPTCIGEMRLASPIAQASGHVGFRPGMSPAGLEIFTAKWSNREGCGKHDQGERRQTGGG